MNIITIYAVDINAAVDNKRYFIRVARMGEINVF